MAGTPPVHNLAVKIPSGDIEQYSTQLDVPNSEVDDTSWVVLHWSMSPHGLFYAHVVQGRGVRPPTM